MGRSRTGNGSNTGRHQRVAADGDAGMDGPATDAVLRMGRFFRSGEVSPDTRALYRIGGRDADTFYRDRGERRPIRSGPASGGRSGCD